jgi:hypothetical protein
MNKTIKELLKISAVIAAFLAAGGTIWNSCIASNQYNATEETKIDNSIKSAYDNLIRPHNDDDSAPLSVESSMNELAEAINKKARQDPQKIKELRSAFAVELVKLFRKNSIDFGQDGNLQLDLRALNEWKQEYPEELKKDVISNVNIIYRYYMALYSLRKKDPKFMDAAKIKDDGGVRASVDPQDLKDANLLNNAHLLYSMHVQILRDSIKDSVKNADKKYLDDAICWYHEATNPELTRKIFPNDNIVEVIKNCKQ